MVEALNKIGKDRTPSIFIIDYEKKKFYINELSKCKNDDVLFKIENFRNYKKTNKTKIINLKKYPLSLNEYKKKFDLVSKEIENGNTYLLNLTFKTPIVINASLKEIFLNSNAKFKLYFKDKFVCFSPEEFISIKNNTIYTYPMKGTIDANIENAKYKLLNNKKELAEHTMIVDLLRNDLSIIASNTKVDNFRFIQKIKAGDKELFQTSSKISAVLEKNWQDRLGYILDKLLPAGSITGTPKRKTIDIIKRIEDYNRGFFTGIFGYFDGENLQSAVIIRYIEKDKDKFFYKSGGGITSDSSILLEYQEMINKIYIPN